MQAKNPTLMLLLALGLICGSGVATYAQDAPKPKLRLLRLIRGEFPRLKLRRS